MSGGSTRDENFRATIPTHTPEGDKGTLILTRQGSRLWLTFGATTESTAELDREQGARLVELLQGALATTDPES